jgi:hypothetical protein
MGAIGDVSPTTALNPPPPLPSAPLPVVGGQMLTAIVADPAISGDAKAAIAERWALIDKRLADGADEELQLCDGFACAVRAIAGVRVDADAARIVIM